MPSMAGTESPSRLRWFPSQSDSTKILTLWPHVKDGHLVLAPLRPLEPSALVSCLLPIISYGNSGRTPLLRMAVFYKWLRESRFIHWVYHRKPFLKKPILWQNSILSYQCWTDGNDRNAFLISPSGPKARSQSPRGTRGYKPGGYPRLSPWPWWCSLWPWKAALAECAAQLPRRINEGPRKMPQGYKHTHSKVSTRSSKMHIRDASYHLYEKSRMGCFILYFFSFLSNPEHYFDFKKKYWFK